MKACTTWSANNFFFSLAPSLHETTIGVEKKKKKNKEKSLSFLFPLREEGIVDRKKR